MDRDELIKKIASLYIAAIILTGVLLFLPAGTFLYWQAWVYMAIIFIPMLFVMRYMLRRDPELLEKRLRMKETSNKQSIIMKFMFILYALSFIIPGLDKRYNWSSVPPTIVIVSNIIVLAGYLLVFLTFRENRYASRIIEVQEDQEVVTTGPYSIVRHPMYLGAMIMLIFTPLALGSYWAFFSVVLLMVALVARILNEENFLLRELKGYREYVKKIRYRLIPGIW